MKTGKNGVSLIKTTDPRIKETISRILSCLKPGELVTYSQIQKQSGIDGHTLRTRLNWLVESKELISVYNKHSFEEFKKGFYYTKPSDSVNVSLEKIKYHNILGESFYFGIKDDVPVFLQASFKLDLLRKKKDQISIFIKKKLEANNSELKSLDNFNQVQDQTLFQLKIIYTNLAKMILKYNYEPILGYYLEQLVLELISKIDKMYETYETITGKEIFPKLVKTIIADLSMKFPFGNIMSMMGVSKDVRNKFYKEIFNVDGFPKIYGINKINEESIGQKEFGSIIPSGETLFEKWKNLE